MGDLVDIRQNELKTRKICRFCLSQNVEDLSNIYSRENRMKSAPLPLQVMACVSIEVFSNDSMPCYVCSECRLLFDYCYRFKQMCKKADTCLRHYPLTGTWTDPLEKPKIPDEILKKQPQRQRKLQEEFHQKLQQLSQQKVPKKQTNLNLLQVPKMVASQTTLKIDLDDEGTGAILTMVDAEQQQLEDYEQLAELDLDAEHEIEIKPNIRTKQPPAAGQKKETPKKLLNKAAIRILNKEANPMNEPVMSKPMLRRDVDGNMAVVTEILEVGQAAEVNPVENAAVIETNVFPCPHCDRSFPLRQLLDIHLVNHNRERSFLCPNCDKSFFSKYDLQKHVLVHTGEKPFKCVVCDKGFTRSTLLHRHEKCHTDIPKYICVFCEKPFISQEEMEKHTERHRKNRPFSCKVCSKSFAFKQGLERHEVVHSRIQPFQCQYCDQSFPTPSKLARHLTAHAGVRPYPCKLCPKSYLLSHHLTRHMRSHKNGIGSYKCNDCDKTFSKRDDLIYHSAVHATQTLMCPLCKDTFENIETVTEHVKQHAEGEAFACEFCDLIYMTAERLQCHTDAEHADEMIAYNEDEQTNSQPKIRNEAKNDEQTNRDIEEVIEEFLIDELSDNGKAETVSSIVVKEETGWQTVSEDNDIQDAEESGKLDSSHDMEVNSITDDRMLDYMNMIEESETVNEPPVKVAKTTEVNKRLMKLTPPPPTAIRRKIPAKATQTRSLLKAESSSPKENKKPIQNPSTPVVRVKAEKMILPSPAAKTRQPTIQAALQGLPKSVSVKKVGSSTATPVAKPPVATSVTSASKPSTPAIIKKPVTQKSPATPETQTKPSPQTRQLPLRQRPEPSPKGNPQTQSKPTTSQSKLGERKQTPTKPADVAEKKTPSLAEVGTGDKKIVEMMIGDKKVKVQRITMSKSQAAAMAREGRIQMKEGTMILKKGRSQVPAKVAKK